MSDATPPDDLGFDPIDAALGERLRVVAPRAPDAESTLAGLRPTLVRARRRRHAMVAGVAALGAALVVSVGALALRSGTSGDVKTPPATRPDTTSTAPTTAPTTIETLPGATAPVGTTPGTMDDRGGNRGPGGGSGPDSGSGSSGSGSSGSGSSGSGSSGSGSSGSGDDG